MATKKRGRPTKYRPEYDEQVYKLCLLGATDEQLADFFDVAVSTIFEWEGVHPSFSEARKNGKERADANVAEALYHRALGYEHDAVKIMQHDGGSFEHRYVKRYPPDTAAAFIWLKNRAGWRDRFELTGRDGGPIETTPLVVYLPANGRDELPEAIRNRMARSKNVASSTNGNGSEP